MQTASRTSDAPELLALRAAQTVSPLAGTDEQQSSWTVLEKMFFFAYGHRRAVFVLTGDLALLQRIDLPDTFSALAFSRERGHLAVACRRELLLFRPAWQPARHEFRWVPAAAAPTPDPLASLSWQAALPDSYAAQHAPAFAPDTDACLVAGGRALHLFHLHLGDGPAACTELLALNVGRPVRLVSVSRDSRFFLTLGASDCLLKIWYERNDLLNYGIDESHDRQFAFLYLRHPMAVLTARWAEVREGERNILMTTCRDGIVRFWVQEPACHFLERIDVPSFTLVHSCPTFGRPTVFQWVNNLSYLIKHTPRAPRPPEPAPVVFEQDFHYPHECELSDYLSNVVPPDFPRMDKWLLQIVDRSTVNVYKFSIGAYESPKMSHELTFTIPDADLHGAAPTRCIALSVSPGEPENIWLYTMYDNREMRWCSSFSAIGASFSLSPRELRAMVGGSLSGRRASTAALVANTSTGIVASLNTDKSTSFWAVGDNFPFENPHAFQRRWVAPECSCVAWVPNSARYTFAINESLFVSELIFSESNDSSVIIGAIDPPADVIVQTVDFVGCLEPFFLRDGRDSSARWATVVVFNGSTLVLYENTLSDDRVLTSACLCVVKAPSNITCMSVLRPFVPLQKEFERCDSALPPINPRELLSFVLFTGHEDGSVRLWSIKDCHMLEEFNSTKVSDHPIAAVKSASFDSFIALAQKDDKAVVKIYDLQLSIDTSFVLEKEIDLNCPVEKARIDIRPIGDGFYNLSVYAGEGIDIFAKVAETRHFQYLSCTWEVVATIPAEEFGGGGCSTMCWTANNSLIVGCDKNMYLISRFTQVANKKINDTLAEAGLPQEAVFVPLLQHRALPYYHPRIAEELLLKGDIDKAGDLFARLEEQFGERADTLLKNVILPKLDIVEQKRLDIAHTVYKEAKDMRTFDVPGKRFLISSSLYKQNAHFNLLDADRFPSVQSTDFFWACLSESQELILDRVLFNKADLDWDDVREVGGGFWITKTSILRALAEKIAKSRFASTKDPESCALFYLAIGKKNALQALFKYAHNDKIYKFLQNDFNERKWKVGALKNAYILEGQHRYEYSAAFFLLAGEISDCLKVCVSKLNDLQLAFFIARLAEPDEQGPLKKQLFADMETIAREKNDPGLLALAHWLQNDKEHALSILQGEFTADDGVSIPSEYNTSFYHLHKFLSHEYPKNKANVGHACKKQSRQLKKVTHMYAQCGLTDLTIECLGEVHKEREFDLEDKAAETTTASASALSFSSIMTDSFWFGGFAGGYGGGFGGGGFGGGSAATPQTEAKEEKKKKELDPLVEKLDCLLEVKTVFFTKFRYMAWHFLSEQCGKRHFHEIVSEAAGGSSLEEPLFFAGLKFCQMYNIMSWEIDAIRHAVDNQTEFAAQMADYFVSFKDFLMACLHQVAITTHIFAANDIALPLFAEQLHCFGQQLFHFGGLESLDFDENLKSNLQYVVFLGYFLYHWSHKDVYKVKKLLENDILTTLTNLSEQGEEAFFRKEELLLDDDELLYGSSKRMARGRLLPVEMKALELGTDAAEKYFRLVAHALLTARTHMYLRYVSTGLMDSESFRTFPELMFLYQSLTILYSLLKERFWGTYQQTLKDFMKKNEINVHDYFESSDVFQEGHNALFWKWLDGSMFKDTGATHRKLVEEVLAAAMPEDDPDILSYRLGESVELQPFKLEGIMSFCVSHDGKAIALVDGKGELYEFMLSRRTESVGMPSGGATVTLIQKLKRTTGVCCLCAHPTMNLYLTGGADGVLRLWEFSNPQSITTFTGNTHSKVTRVRFNSTGRRFGAIFQNGTFGMWQTGRGSHCQPFFMCQAHESLGSDFCFLDDGTLVATCGHSPTSGSNVCVWNTVLSPQMAGVMACETIKSALTSMAYSQKMGVLVAGDVEGVLHCVDVKKMRETMRTRKHGTFINAVDMDAEETVGVSAAGDGSVKVWRLPVVEEYDQEGAAAKKVDRKALFATGVTGLAMVQLSDGRAAVLSSTREGVLHEQTITAIFR